MYVSKETVKITFNNRVSLKSILFILKKYSNKHFVSTKSMSIARHIKIELEIHAITCPGAWLCQSNGDVELTITALGYAFTGKPLKPRFPLCYHEKFVMDGYFSDVTSVTELEKALDDEQINFTLWQKGRRLAYYLNKIGVILNYTGCMNHNFASTDNSIIMTRGSNFPSTITPKIEYTASIQYNNKCMKCNQSVLSENHGVKRIVKNLYESGANKINFVHQKPVCHARAKHSHRWRQNVKASTQKRNDLCEYCLDAQDMKRTHALYSANRDSGVNKIMTNVDQHENCGHLRNDPLTGPFHSENKCEICLRYALMFDRSKEEINGQ